MLARIPTLQVLLAAGLATAALFQKPFSSSHQHPARIGSQTYADQVVLRLATQAAEDVQAITQACEQLNLDVWSITGKHIDVRLPESEAIDFFKLVPEHLSKATTQMIPDLGHAIRQNQPHSQIGNFLTEQVPSINDTFFSEFQTVEAINAWLSLVVALHKPVADLISLGKTFEGREIQGLKISQPKDMQSGKKKKKNSKRKVILVHGAQHAREWISVSTVCYLAYSLVAGAAGDQAIARLVRDFDWVFIPTLNVDGYAYSFEDRLWRKNRQSTSVPYCKGVDLDRNWDYGWDAGQASANAMSSPCSENYQGSRPFEAQESRLLSEYIQGIKDDPSQKLVGYLDLHSYAQTILYPYALSCDVNVRDEESLIELGVGASKAMKASSGQHYETASACNQDGHVLTSANANSGAALDWVYHSGVPWSYVVKLRDTGSYGFLVPKEEIVPTGEEMLDFLKYFGTFITEHNK
ncbi:putative Zinc carboxypeptidase [Taphrina deformans PYCC 5710]|uniref:Inactive metallocarboxypeptidase ECM14 n=1 Tax=Taphrina deformans (strain PYCC 5710 / ATCC 11124 / CBS 356.35 / IMI 108563 / JCM 9778 / NBRC 8474) TaxID=1097556 RepID=R4XDI6_TAPDE|nr:putative Zinc carboxypeptidase [Taphrina deformans PYCC 5710]|eukprot:CCG81409.1 putative Zinc carboxypeptidase [Taphrina deformans PYCC 5710]